MSELKVWVPDTVVYEEGTEPFWLFSGPDGIVRRTEKFVERNIVTKFGNIKDMCEVCSVVKSNGNHDDYKLNRV